MLLSIDMSTSGQAFQNTDAISPAVKSTVNPSYSTQRGTPPTSAPGPPSAQAYLNSLPDFSYMLTSPMH